MSALPDPDVIYPALAVLAILGLFFWHTFVQSRQAVAAIVRYADRRSAAQRSAIENENAARESNLRPTIQVALILALIGLVTLMALRKFGFM